MLEKKEVGGLLLHLSKFPSLKSIFPLSRTDQAIFIEQLDMWKEEHEKLFNEVVSQIQDLKLKWVTSERATLALDEVLALLEGGIEK